MEVYEYLLVKSQEMGFMRSQATHQLRDELPSFLAAPLEPAWSEPETRRLNAKLAMFGKPEVRAAFRGYENAHFRWVEAVREYIDVARNEDESEEHNRVVQQKLTAVENAKQTADTIEGRLPDTIANTVQRVPKLQRFRRRHLPKN